VGATYRGRFAPSPTGPLHAGSLVAALASWLDAKAHAGEWLIRIEDVDVPRCLPGMSDIILGQLSTFGLTSDGPVVYQSRRTASYQQALDTLVENGLAYPCRCSRKDIEAALNATGQMRQRHGELIYPGTCRHGFTPPPQSADANHPAWRFRTDILEEKVATNGYRQAQAATTLIANGNLTWTDRRLKNQQQNVEEAVGDFALKRNDGCFTYQLAVVVDDAAQGITHVVRGEDLADNTARQILLQRALGFVTPHYLHTPLVLGDNGEKLSKQNGAKPLNTARPLAELNAVAAVLGLRHFSENTPLNPGDALAMWVNEWRHLYNPAGEPNNLAHHPDPV
jgi:glutamyl-Q tRNA(Asp) synthetase